MKLSSITRSLLIAIFTISYSPKIIAQTTNLDSALDSQQNDFTTELTPTTESIPILSNVNHVLSSLSSPDEILSDLEDILVNTAEGIVNDLESLWTDTWDSLIGTESTLIVGSMGIPDPTSVENTIENQSTLTTDLLSEVIGTATGGNGSVIVQSDLNTQFMADLAKSVANGATLSETAQEQALAKLELSTQATNQSFTLAQDSEGQDVSQNILRNISSQLAQQQILDQLILSEQQQARIDRAIHNQVGAETLTEIQGNNLREQRQALGGSRSAMNQASMFMMPAGGLSQ